MEKDKYFFIKNYISSMQISLTEAGYIELSNWPYVWRNINYTPSYNKLYYICSGEGSVKIGSKEFFPKPGQIVLMPAEVLQSYSSINENSYTKYWCHFTATCGELNFFDIVQFPYCFDIKDKSKIESLFCNLISNHNGNDLTSHLKARSNLLDVLSCFIDNCDLGKVNISSSSSVEKLNNIINYIHTHLSENINLDELAKIAHFHPNYFIKFFNKHMGISPIHYINKVKMEKAKNLLYKNDINVTEIAYATGFNDLSHFSKIFKNHTGFSPSEFRNMSYQYELNKRIF